MRNFADRKGWDGTTPIRKSFSGSVKAVDDEEDRVVKFTISTSEVDRDGDVINQRGWDLRSYRKNPVVLWGHSNRELPIAKARKVKVEDGSLVAEAVFPDEGVYPFADVVYNMLKSGFLNATSVGFLPTDVTAVFDEEIPGFKINKAELLEFSVVPVPANPGALVQQRDNAPLVKTLYDAIEGSRDDTEKEFLGRAYTLLTAEVHPGVQEMLARKNFGKESADVEGEGGHDPDPSSHGEGGEARGDDASDGERFAAAPGGDIGEPDGSLVPEGDDGVEGEHPSGSREASDVAALLASVESLTEKFDDLVDSVEAFAASLNKSMDRVLEATKGPGAKEKAPEAQAGADGVNVNKTANDLVGITNEKLVEVIGAEVLSQISKIRGRLPN